MVFFLNFKILWKNNKNKKIIFSILFFIFNFFYKILKSGNKIKSDIFIIKNKIKNKNKNQTESKFFILYIKFTCLINTNYLVK